MDYPRIFAASGDGSGSAAGRRHTRLPGRPSALPLRVAIACSGLGHVTRGIESWAADTAAALRRHGGQVEVALYGGAQVPGGLAVACWQRTGWTARWLSQLGRLSGGWRYGMGSPYEVEQTSFALNLWRRIGRHADILHVQDPQLGRIFERAHRLGLSRPRVILANGTGEGAAVLRRFAWLQHLTPGAAQQWAAAPPAGQRSRTIPNFIDTDHFRPTDRAAARDRLGLPQDRTIILCSAAIRRRHKRIDVLLREFAAANATAGGTLHLVVVGGDDPETPGLLAEAAGLLGASAQLRVEVPREQMRDFYGAADLFVLPSLHELFGIVLLEAMACGLPVLCHDVPDFRYVVGPAGHFADLSVPGGITRGILGLRTEAQRASLGKAARRQVEQHFSADAVVPDIIEMYRAVAAQERRYA